MYRSPTSKIKWESTNGPKLETGESLTSLTSYGTAMLFAGTSQGRVHF